MAEEIRDGDLLRTETFGDADSPLAADGGARCGRLREDATGWRVGGVEAVFKIQAETEGAGVVAGFREGEASEVWDFDFAAVNGETHGDEGGEQSDDDHRQGAERGVEDAMDGLPLHGQEQDTG